MTTIMKKSMRDVLGEGARSAGIVLSLAIGIAGFLSVLSAYAILTEAIDQGYEASRPVSASIALPEADAAAVAVVLGNPGVAAAEPRRTVSGRLRAGQAPWRNVSLFIRPGMDRSRVGMVELEKGRWPAGPGEIAMERDAFQVAGAKLGDEVVIRAEGGGEHSFRVTASIHDPGVAQARMENIVYAYAAPEALAPLGLAPSCDEIVLRVAQGSKDEAHIREVTAAASASLAASGFPVGAATVPEPGHPHAKLMLALLLANSLFGAFILLLSGVIVFNVLTALLAGQRRQIGVMKALGGSRARIASVYLAEAALFGLAAIALALPIGVFAGGAIARWLAGFVNFDVPGVAAPAWVYALVFAVGTAVPVLAALIPVWLGTRVTAREALLPSLDAERGYGSSAFDRFLALVLRGSRSLGMALRNLGRNRLRAILSLLILSVAGVFFMSALNVRKSLQATIKRSYESQLADLSFSFASRIPSARAEEALRGLANLRAEEAWVAAEGSLVRDEGPLARGEGQVLNRDRVLFEAPPPGSRLMHYDLVAGTELDGGSDVLVANSILYDRLGRPAIGSSVALAVEGRQESFVLRGLQYDAFGVSTAYVSRAFFDARSPGGAGVANQMRLSLARSDAASTEQSIGEADRALREAGIPPVSVSTKAESVFVMKEHMVMIYLFLLVVACILCGVGGLGLATAVSLNVSERRREMGVLRAIGATPRRVAAIVVSEALAIGLLSWALAAALSLPLSKAIGDLLLRIILSMKGEINFSAEPLGIAAWLLVVSAGCFLSALLPALRAARVPVRDALAYE